LKLTLPSFLAAAIIVYTREDALQVEVICCKLFSLNFKLAELSGG
jgi:hypothetical protein